MTITLGGEHPGTYPLDAAAVVTLNGVASTLGALPVGSSLATKLIFRTKVTSTSSTIALILEQERCARAWF